MATGNPGASAAGPFRHLGHLPRVGHGAADQIALHLGADFLPHPVELGVDGVVRKPCHFEVLAACIARQLSRAETMKRLIGDKAALDAKIISRVIELRETQAQLGLSERERRRLAAIVDGKAA